MIYNFFNSNNQKIGVSENHLLTPKKQHIPLTDLFIYRLYDKNINFFLLSGQYAPTKFYNTILFEKDDLINNLEERNCKIIEKQIISKENASDYRYGTLTLDDGSVFSYGPLSDTGRYALSVKRKDDNRSTPHCIELKTNSGRFNFAKPQKLENESDYVTNPKIIPLNLWKKNEAYWQQHYKLNKGKSYASKSGCMLQLVLLFFSFIAVVTRVFFVY